MTKQLGERLLKAKLITPQQLDDALKNQAIFGGRLGSQLLDNGAIDEVTLARQLGEVYRVPYAHSSHLARLPEELLHCVPKELAEKFLVIPLKRENKRLYLAMADPGDLAAIEELGFRTGFVIRPVIVPEAVIIRHLKRYYGISRIGHYISLAEEPSRLSSRPAKGSDQEDDPGTWLGGPEQDAIMAEWEQKNRDEQKLRSASGDTQPAATQPRLESLGERLASHLDRERMADLIIEHIGLEYTTGALLLVRGNSAIGWRAVCKHQPVKDFQLLQIPLDQPSVLQSVSFNKNAYTGPLAPLPINQQLATAIGSPAQGDILVAPVILLGRLIALIYLDNPRLNLPVVLQETRKIAAMLTIGMELLILKNKLAAM